MVELWRLLSSIVVIVRSLMLVKRCLTVDYRDYFLLLIFVSYIHFDQKQAALRSQSWWPPLSGGESCPPPSGGWGSGPSEEKSVSPQTQGIIVLFSETFIFDAVQITLGHLQSDDFYDTITFKQWNWRTLKSLFLIPEKQTWKIREKNIARKIFVIEGLWIV